MFVNTFALWKLNSLHHRRLRTFLPPVLQEVPGDLLEERLDVGSLLARGLEQLRPDLAAVGLGGGELHGAVLVEGAASDVLSTLPAALREPLLGMEIDNSHWCKLFS